MRRVVAAVLGTIAGTTLLIGAKVGTRPPADHGALVSGPPGEPASDGLTGSGSPAVTPSRSPGPGGAPSTGPASRTPAPTRTTSRSTAPAQTSGSGLRAGTFRGAAVTHKYGTLQVTITVSDQKITNVTASYSTSLRVSEQINADALPKLRQEALAAQSANIATVSGATYTSNAYRTSLQSALDKAKG